MLSACITAGNEAGQNLETVAAAKVCTLFPKITYSAKNDTPETVSEVRTFNTKRNGYCQ